MKKTGGDFDSGMKQTWIEIKETIGNQTGKTDNSIATIRAQNDEMVSGSEGKEE